MKTFNDFIVESKNSDKLADLINNSINKIDDSMSYKDFADAVSKVLIDDYGKHLYGPFMKTLESNLK